MKFEPKLYTLSNGVNVILDPMDLATVSIKVRFSTGARDEKPENSGITHFCEHMLMKGTPTLPSRTAIREFLENNGGVSNAITGGRFLQLDGRIIAENTNVLLEVFADQLQNSLFEEKKIEIEKNVILDELRRALSSNPRKHDNLVYENLFNFSVFRTLGTEENIKSFTREQAQNWLKQRLSSKNCTICVSGKIDNPDSLINKIEELFKFLPTHEVSQHPEIKYTPCDKFLHEPSVKNVWIDILFPYLRLENYENRRSNLAESKFRRYLGQELSEVVRQNNGLVYGIGTTGYGNEFDGVHGIHTETSPENLEKTVALIAQTAYRIYNKDKITQPVIDRFLKLGRLADADFLESAAHRRDVLLNHFIDFGKLYDFESAVEMDKSITAEDAINCSTGFFDGPMSIISFGAEYNLDLRQIWKDNFK